jgi:hypothetical protein
MLCLISFLKGVGNFLVTEASQREIGERLAKRKKYLDSNFVSLSLKLDNKYCHNLQHFSLPTGSCPDESLIFVEVW